MKYIRTKDGIYKVTHDGLCYKEAKSQTMLMLVEHKNEKDKIEYEEITTHKELAMGKHRFKEHIIKQADTIEELCDEFVVVSVSFLKPYKITRKWVETLKQAQKYKPSDKCIVYGAIWTDKGLIYVAKMNDKGELELL